MSAYDRLLKTAIAATQESDSVDFKAQFDVDSAADWCEVIKDLVAMANSGGGAIVIGCNNQGAPGQWDPARLLKLDPAKVTDRICKYTDLNFGGFEIREARKNGRSIAVILVGPSPTPMVFCKPGQYADPSNSKLQKTAFGQGTLYFRHGAKSETGTTDDIRDVIGRTLKSERRSLMKNVLRVARAPSGSTVQVVAPTLSGKSSAAGLPVRVSSDPDAAVVGVVDYEKLNPYRQKDLVVEVRKLLATGTIFTTHDIQAIRHLYGVDSNDAFCHLFQWGGRQYSSGFAKWIADQQAADVTFLANVRSRYRDYRRERGHRSFTGKRK